MERGDRRPSVRELVRPAAPHHPDLSAPRWGADTPGEEDGAPRRGVSPQADERRSRAYAEEFTCIPRRKGKPISGPAS